MPSLFSVLVIIYIVYRVYSRTKGVARKRPGTAPGAPEADERTMPAAKQKPARPAAPAKAAKPAPAAPNRPTPPVVTSEMSKPYNGAPSTEGVSLSREGGDFTWQHNAAYDEKPKKAMHTRAARAVNAEEMRRAVILKEVLDQPVSLRAPR